VAHFAVLRVIAVREGLPGPEVALILRRHLLAGELKTFLYNAPPDTLFATLVRLSGMRWSIEPCFDDGRQYLGMGDDEVRSWRGWPYHRTDCLSAHGFPVGVHLR
jgi:SRSO17 transposase